MLQSRGLLAPVAVVCLSFVGRDAFAVPGAAGFDATTSGGRAVHVLVVEPRAGAGPGQGRRASPWSGDEVPIVRAALPDSDGDGIPDAVETVLGTDPAYDDAADDPDGDGYTNFEDYANGVAASDGACAPRGPIDGGTEEGGDATLVEAEAMDLVAGFAADTNPHASEGGLIRSDGAERSHARIRPSLPGGVYDVAVRYFDEDDGISVLGLRVDGQLAALWPWDEERGTALVDGASRAVRLVPCLGIETGSVIEIIGSADGGEPLRVDAIEFRPAAP